MVYVFVFLGEFGVELLNWQGVIRKFALTISSDDTIVCCSRGNVHLFYEMADIYIDISEVESFKQSQASGYFSCLVRDNGKGVFFRNHLSPMKSLRGAAHQRHIESDLRSFILKSLRKQGIDNDISGYNFIFSSQSTHINGCKFGTSAYRNSLFLVALKSVIRQLAVATTSIHRLDSTLLKVWKKFRSFDPRSRGEIYGLLDTNNNLFKKIEPDISYTSIVEEKLGWKLTEPFILCQSRRRDTPQACDDEFPRDQLDKFIEELGKLPDVKIVLLTFNTGRRNDSYSDLAQKSCWEYQCDSFPEQACLIHFAKHCLFFTEGDLGSHIYIPPLMGKDVTMIAPRSIYNLDSAPIEFWNREVFRFGGQIIGETSQKVLESQESMQHFCDILMLRLENK